MVKSLKRKKGSSLKFVTLGYLSIILLGSIFLCLPIAAKSGTWTPYIDSLFTATSATCVTGLVVYDTYIHWSIYGQIAILLMIQMGGIGFMSLVTMLTKSLGLRLRFKDRKFLMESVGANEKSGISVIVQNITFGSLTIEIIGACLLSIRFIPQFGFANGVYYSIFHSISAFCNAGFDIMGILGTPYASFAAYSGDILVNLTLMGLIFCGGIGFIVWNDVIESKFKFKEMKLHTQLTLAGSIVLIVLSTFVFYLYEMNNLYANLSFGEGFLRALFQSVSTRTAGFSTMDMSQISNGSSLLTIFLMFVGGSSGSTAGGIKVTTLLVIILGVIALSRNNGDIILNGKKISKDILHQALAILATYLLSVCVVSALICGIEGNNCRLDDIVFETVSAMGTVGLSRGITAALTSTSKMLLAILMYVGRVGILTIVFAFIKPQKEPTIIIPEENVMVG